MSRTIYDLETAPAQRDRLQEVYSLCKRTQGQNISGIQGTSVRAVIVQGDSSWDKRKIRVSGAMCPLFV